VQMTNDLQVGEIGQHLIQTLNDAGFLENEEFERKRAERQREFRDSPVRLPAHAGSAYPADPEEAREVLAEYMDGAEPELPPAPADPDLFAIAAPHVSPSGGWRSYRAAYRMLRPEHAERTFVILATSHYGAPEKFGLTRKSFVTPLGETASNVGLVDWLEKRGGSAVQTADPVRILCAQSVWRRRAGGR
jgi:hypothetical protein